jgi:hypothetical protein
MLISVPEIRQELSGQNETKEKYQNLKEIQTTEIIAYIVLTLIAIASYLIKEPRGLLAGLLPLAILMNLFRKNRQCVADISERFLLRNIQPDTLNRQTLYQTCECLSQGHPIPSLVDIITYQDFTARNVLLGTVLFFLFIYPLKSWQLLVTTGTIFLAALAIVNTSMVLRKRGKKVKK